MKNEILLPHILSLLFLVSPSLLWSQTSKHLVFNRVDSAAFYITTQQQYSQFKDNFRLNQTGVGIKWKKVKYTSINNFQYAYGEPQKGWQVNNEFYYTPKGKKNYQYAAASFSDAVWFPKFIGAISNFYVGIKKLEIENGVKYIVLRDQKNVWLINTGIAYALKKNLLTVKWIYLNNGISNNDFILGYRYYFNENSVIAFNVLGGTHNMLLDFNNIVINSSVGQQKYYGFNFNTTFELFEKGFLVLNYTYNYFYDKNYSVNNWNLNIASVGLNYRIH